MSNLFSRRHTPTNFMPGLQGPVWIASSFTTTTAGDDPSIGLLICPVPFRFYRLLGLVASINITTVTSAASTFTVKGVNVADGTANTTVFTGTTPSIPLSTAAGTHIIKMFSALVPEYSAINGGIKILPGGTGAQFSTTSAATLGGTGTTSAVATHNDSNVIATHRGVFPSFVQDTATTLGLGTYSVNWLVQPISKM